MDVQDRPEAGCQRRDLPPRRGEDNSFAGPEDAWEALEAKIKSWLDAMKVLVRTLFYGKRILCDQTFGTSDAIRDWCFGEITKEGTAVLFGFPEAIAESGKKWPEKVFRLLDMCVAISDIWPDIEALFKLSSTSSVRSLALISLVLLGESVHSSLAEFESAILKDSSKWAVRGCGLHPLTVDAMSHLCILSDYNSILADVLLAGRPKSPARPPLPESYFDSLDRVAFLCRKSPSAWRGCSSSSSANSTARRSTTRTYPSHTYSSQTICNTSCRG